MDTTMEQPNQGIPQFHINLQAPTEKEDVNPISDEFDDGSETDTQNELEYAEHNFNENNILGEHKDDFDSEEEDDISEDELDDNHELVVGSVVEPIVPKTEGIQVSIAPILNDDVPDQPITVVINPPSENATSTETTTSDTTSAVVAVETTTSLLSNLSEESASKLKNAKSQFVDLIRSFNDEESQLSFLHFVENTLKTIYGISLFGENTRGPGRRKVTDGEKKRPGRKSTKSSQHSQINSPSTTSTTSTPSLPVVYPDRGVRPKRAASARTLFNSDSVLIHVNMRDIINKRTFDLLSPSEKDSLIQLLPNCDTNSIESLQDLFSSSVFLGHMAYFQEVLEMGEFDRGSEDYKQYLKPKKKREVPTEPWKQKFYEEYWGQKKQTEPEEDSQNFTPISFVEIARKENPDLVIPEVPVNSIQAALSVFEPQVSASAQFHSTKAVGNDVLFEEPSDVVLDDDDFIDDLSDEDVPRKRRKRREVEELDDEEIVIKSNGTPRKRKEKSEKDPNLKKRKKKTGGDSGSFRRCAHTILTREKRAMTAHEIIKIGIKEGMISTAGKTPQNTLASVLYCEMKKDPNCAFVKVAPMTFALKTFDWTVPAETEIAHTPEKPSKPRKRKPKEETTPRATKIESSMPKVEMGRVATRVNTTSISPLKSDGPRVVQVLLAESIQTR